MHGLDDPSLAAPGDDRTQLIIDMLTENIFKTAQITTFLQSASLRPGDYPLETARLTWTAAVRDAARRGRLGELIRCVVAQDPAFGTELERRWQPLVHGPGDWYHNEDPFASCFVGVRASRAIIDRAELRSGLRNLATDQYWVLVVLGDKGTGKTHSWFLVAHLRDAGVLTGKLIRVTTRDWVGEVTGEGLVASLADKLGVNIGLMPSGELDDARIRKLVDMLAGRYPDDGVIRWIVLDGLDGPGVRNSARDVAKRLITMVDEGELPRTRLIVTGFDGLGLTVGPSVQVERISPIGKTLVYSFLGDVAQQLGGTVTAKELDECVHEVFASDEPSRDLRRVEDAVVRLAKTRWGGGAQNGA